MNLDYSDCDELPPCTTCLVRAVCGNTLVRQGDTKDRYLIVEYAEKCPAIVTYFGHHYDGRIKHNHEKIAKIARLHGATNGEYFVWFANELSIYDSHHSVF